MKRIGGYGLPGLTVFLLANTALAGDCERQLFTVAFAPGVEAVTVPVRFSHRLSAQGGLLTELDASGPAPAAYSATGEMVALVRAQPAGRRRVFWLSAGGVAPGGPEVRLERPAADGSPLRVVARTYRAEVDPKRGGVLSSLAWLSPEGRRLETLGPGGMAWNWTGSPGRADQAIQGAMPIEVIEHGSGRVEGRRR